MLIVKENNVTTLDEEKALCKILYLCRTKTWKIGTKETFLNLIKKKSYQ